MFRKVFKQISWNYAIGEIVLIFLGVTIAIWFNNWNESRKLKKIEVRSLSEVKNAIEQDLEDIKENIFGFSERVSLYRMLIKHIENDLPPNETLLEELPYLRGNTTFLSNTGPYETLKSRGLETIRNDSIRLAIALYYDFEYEKIQSVELQHLSHHNNYLKPEMLEHFSFVNDEFIPFDRKALMKDFSFKQAIYWALQTDGYLLELYEDVEDEGKELIVALTREIKRLEQ